MSITDDLADEYADDGTWPCCGNGCEARVEEEGDYCEGCEPEDEDDRFCTCCAGTGEGQYDGARCPACKGKGVTPLPEDFDC